MGDRRVRLAVAAGLTGVVLGGTSTRALVRAASPVPAVAAPRVLVTTTGSDSETRRTLPITRRAKARKRVVMSMGPHELPGLKTRDRLELTAELQVTDDCRHQAPRCAGRPYRFSPRIGSRLVLASHRRTTGGRHAIALSARKRIRCRQSVPNRQHHCVLVFTGASKRIHDPDALPCGPSTCHVNFVVDAHNKRAQRGDKLIIGANKPDGFILQDKGRINAIRLRPGSQRRAPTLETTERRHMRIPLDQTPTVVLSRRLNGLRKNTQLAVLAQMRTDVSKLPYSARVTTHLILGRTRHSTATSRWVAHLASPHGEIAETNGSNCTRAQTRCPYTKVGVLRMLRDARNRAGEPIPLFVNLYVVSNPKRASRRPVHRLKVVPPARMKVTRYKASLRG
jgi:hypothetical protein